MEHWAAKKKNEEAENQFHRLPDDVVLNVFDKLSDIRCLCRCFLVSKRFSSLVARVQTVSINGVVRDSNETERKNPQGQGNELNFRSVHTYLVSKKASKDS
ncbi:hypothetical protein C3L33_05318, partial [Rhododendron williamsianum]